MEANTDGSLVYDAAGAKDARIDRVMTQYRESPNLLGVIGIHLTGLEAVSVSAAALPAIFDLDTAQSEALTVIGKWLGWPRTHCEGQVAPVFGYSRGDLESGCGEAVPTLGYCEDAYYACPGGSIYQPYTFDDDEVYRRHLKARRITLKRSFSRASFLAAVRELFGPDALILKDRTGSFLASPGRAFTPEELSILHLAEQVLPVPLGVRLEWAESGPQPFGYGDGWGGYCDGDWYRVITRPRQTELHDEFGYGPKFRGYCTGTWSSSTQ